jgi:RHS repeat-associated protein
MARKKSASATASLTDAANVAASPISAAGLKPGTFEVDPNGQATYRIPIDIPPGIAGAQPQLEFAYSHRGPNGQLGIGWSLSGLSTISRTRATYAVDGFNGAIGYDSNDRFALDGQRLININGGYGQPGTVYYTEFQSWQQAKAGASATAGFTVTMKNGDIARYGATADSRILAAGGNDVRVWALSSTTDLNGNTVEYAYTQAPMLASGTRGTADQGSYYIDKISYTSNTGATANRFVQFIYETRPDPIVDFEGGYPVNTSYRLLQVAISLAGNTPVRTYALAYQGSGVAQLSQLLTVTQLGADGTSLPPTTMVWQNADRPGFDIASASTLNQHPNLVTVQPMDVTGNGSSDVIQLWTDQSGLHASTYLVTPGAQGPIYVYSSSTLLGSYRTGYQILPMDVNGDGRTDLVIAYPGGNNNLQLAVFLSNGTGFEAADGSPYDTGDSWLGSKHIQFFAMDANGDGRTDLVEAYSHYDPNFGDQLYFRTYLSQFGDGPGQNFTNSIVSATEDPALPTNVLAFWPLDVNADGMMDLVRVWQRGSDSHMIASSYISVSTSIDNVSFSDQVTSDLGTFSLPTQKAFLPVDVNGNGVSDLLQVWQETGQGTALHLTTFLCDAAGGFSAGPDTKLDNRTIGDFYPMGFNGGGFTSLVNKWISGNDQLMFTVYSASPSGKFFEETTFNAGDAGSAVKQASFFPADANGDGKADLLRMSFNANQEIQVLPYLSAGPYPNLVTSITNPLGGQVKVDYLPLTNGQVYGQAEADDTFPTGTGLRFPNPLTPTQFPVQAVLGQATYVVSEYSENNDPSINRFAYATDFALSYADAQLNMLGRGWQGFKSVTRLDKKNGRTTVTTYNQDYPLTGTVAATQTQANGKYATDPRVPKDQTALLLTSETSTYQSFTRANGVDGLKTPVLEVLKMSTRQDFYDYGASNFDYALAQNLNYDNYGNKTYQADLGYVDRNNKPLDPTQAVYSYAQFENDVTGNGWALGYLRYAKVSANSTDTDITKFLAGDYHLTQRTYKPTTYNLASDAKWDNSNNVYLTSTYDYDPFGNRKSETAPGNFTTTYEFDPDYHTFLMRTTSPPNAQGTPLVTAKGYDPRFGVEVARADPNGAISIVGLDPFGRMSVQQGPIPGTPGALGDPNQLTPLVTGTPALTQAFLAAKVVTIIQAAYSNDGHAGIYTEIQSLQSFPTSAARDLLWKQSFCDGGGRERETVTQSGQTAGNVVTLTDFDGDGNVTKQGLPFFSTSSVVTSAPFSVTNTYDVLSRQLTKVTPAGKDGSGTTTSTWEYGSQQWVTMTTAEGSTAPYTQSLQNRTINGKDQVVKSVLAADGNATSTFTYDPIGRVTMTVDPATATSPRGVANIMSYDSLDRKLTLNNPDQNTTNSPTVKALTDTYDATTGRLQKQTNAAGDSTTYGYDGLGRVTKKTLSDGRMIDFTYDGAVPFGIGRLTLVAITAADKSPESSNAFSYDAYGNAASSTLTVTGEAAPFLTSSTFDPQNRLVSQTMPDRSTLVRLYSYGLLTSQSLDGARADYPLDQYSADGKFGELIYGSGTLPGNGIVSTYQHNPMGLLYAEKVVGASGTVLDLAYDYDPLSQLRTVTGQNSSTDNQSFTYLNRRLQTATVPGFMAGNYAYDASGNLTAKDGINFTYQAHYPISGTAGGKTVFSATPDACGRTKTRTENGVTLGFEYDGFGCLRLVTNTSTGAHLRQILSNADGRRLRETDAGGNVTIFVSSSYQVMRPAVGDTVITKYLIDEQGAAASITTAKAKTILYFRRDHKGNITHTFGSDGNVATVVSYDGYGRMTVLSGPDNFQPKYESRSWDNDIGLYYFGARYYDPTTGRFLTPDNQPGGQSFIQVDSLNRFAFELNNPVNGIDPTGHMASWVSALIGALIGVALVAVGIAAIVLTAGAATPGVAATWAAFSGAMIGGGVTSFGYSVTHTKDFKWGEWALQTGVSAVVGGVAGAAFFGLSTGVSVLASKAGVAAAQAGWSAGAVTAARVGTSVALTALGSGAIQGVADFSTTLITGLIGPEKLDGKALLYALGIGFGAGAVIGGLAGAFAGPVDEALSEASPLKATQGVMEQMLDNGVNEVENAPFAVMKADLIAQRMFNLRRIVAIQALAGLPASTLEYYLESID